MENKEKALLYEVLSRIDTLIILMKLDGTVHFVNDAFEKISGEKIEYLDPCHISTLFKSTSIEPIIEGFGYVAKFRKPYVIEKHVIIKRDDHEISLKINMDYIELLDENFIMLAARDLTEEVQLLKVKDIVIRLNNMLSKYSSLDDYFEEILKSLVEAIPYVELGSILLTDDQDIMTMRANVGYDKQMAKNFKRHFEESFFYRNCSDDFTQPVIINNLIDYSMDGFTDILDNVNEIQVASSISSPIIIDGKFKGLMNLDSSKNNIFDAEDLEIMKFLTEQISLVLTSHQLLNQTIYLSKFDQLTGLLNRWYLNEIDEVLIPHSNRHHEFFYFVMMDINNLKRVNDQYGHAYGDRYLREFANLLKTKFRESDLLIRVGGDEFVGVFFTMDELSLNGKMESNNRELNTKMKSLGIEFDCNFAYGMVSFPEESQNVAGLMKLADQRMYEKKMEMKEIKT